MHTKLHEGQNVATLYSRLDSNPLENTYLSGLVYIVCACAYITPKRG